MSLLNWSILSNPYNWAVVVLMVLIGWLAVSFLIPTSEDGSQPVTAMGSR